MEPLGEGPAVDVVDTRSSILAFGDDDSIPTLGPPIGRDEVEEVATAHGQEQKPARRVGEHPLFRLFCPTWIRPIDGVRSRSSPVSVIRKDTPRFVCSTASTRRIKTHSSDRTLGRGDGRIERQLILVDKRIYTRRTRITPFDEANGGSPVNRFQLISSTSITTKESSRFRGTVRAKLLLSFERHTSLVMMRRGASRTTTEKRSFSRMGRGATAPVATHLRMCRTYT